MLLGEACSRQLPRLAISSSAQITRHISRSISSLRLGGWTQKTTRCGLYGSPSSQAQGLNSTKLLDAVLCEDWRQEKFYAVCHEFGSLIPNPGIWIQGSGAAGYVSSTAYFSNSWRIRTRRLMTELTLSLILRFNLRLGGYSIWSVSTSCTIYDQDFGA